MSDYTKSLEQQNEELKQKLAETQQEKDNLQETVEELEGVNKMLKDRANQYYEDYHRIASQMKSITGRVADYGFDIGKEIRKIWQHHQTFNGDR